MFTGLIEEVGTVSSIREREHKQLQIGAPRTARKLRVGDSVAVNGCCLTLSAHRGDQLTFDLLEETFDRTNLKALRHESADILFRAMLIAHLRSSASSKGEATVAWKLNYPPSSRVMSLAKGRLPSMGSA